MSLNIRLRSGEKLAVNGAVLRNSGPRTIHLEVLNKSTLLQERDIMLPEHATSEVDSLYLLVQTLHIEAGGSEEVRAKFSEYAAGMFALAGLQKDVEIQSLVHDVVGLVSRKDTLGALRRIQAKIGKPCGRVRPAASSPSAPAPGGPAAAHAESPAFNGAAGRP